MNSSILKNCLYFSFARYITPVSAMLVPSGVARIPLIGGIPQLNSPPHTIAAITEHGATP